VKKILVVDDSETVRHQVRQALAGGKYTIVECKDGIEGLETIRTSDDLMLVLCDVDMPRMDGVEVCRALHSHATAIGRPLRVWLMTGVRRPELVVRARAAGACDVLAKPFTTVELVGCLEHELQGHATVAQ